MEIQSNWDSSYPKSGPTCKRMVQTCQSEARVQFVTMALERTVVEWMVTLYNDTPELCDFDCFFDMLIESFQDG